VDTTLFTMKGHLDLKKGVADMLKTLCGRSTRRLYAVKELIVFPAFNRFVKNELLDRVIDPHISSDGTMPFKLAETSGYGRIWSSLNEMEAVSHAQLLLKLDKYVGLDRSELAPEKMHSMYIGAVLDGGRVMSLVTVTQVSASQKERKEIPVH
jgi:hypothetical protein